MKKICRYKINNGILGALLVLFAITSLAVNTLNMRNFRRIYEENFSERVQIVNALMATLINGDEIEYYVDLMRSLDDSVKNRQSLFYSDQQELFKLMEQNAPQEELDAVIARMADFHSRMAAYKMPNYWGILDAIKQMKAASHSKYVYIIADTGVSADDGTKLYTYIFDAEDTGRYDIPNGGGLGAADTGEDVILEIYETKKPMEQVLYYNEEPYGELYFAYAPILNSGGEVVAILGTDLGLGEMNQRISNSMLLSGVVFLAFTIIIIFTIYTFVSRSITTPLSELIDTAQRLARGDTGVGVSPSALKQKNELGVLANVIYNMGGIYQRVVADRAILDSSPFTCVIFDLENNIIDCNPKALELYGFDSKDALANGFRDFLVRHLPEYHWDGKKTMPLAERIKTVNETGYCEFETAFHFPGRVVPLSTVMKRIEYRNQPAIIIYQFDLSAVAKARHDLEYRNRLLQALTDASNLFLSSDTGSFDTTLYSALKIIGKTASVGRVHVWKNSAGNQGKLYLSQIYECCLDDTLESGTEPTTNIPYDRVFQSLQDSLYHGRCLNCHVKDLLPEERAFFTPRGVISMLLAPIFIHNRLWGFVGIDECWKERVFSNVEENILRICGYMLMAVDDAIRNEVTMNLITAREAALQTSRAKSEFLAKMSHEIRTPMNAIIGITELVLREEISPAVQEHALSIKGAGNNLLSIINDVLDFSKIESGKLEIVSAEYSFAALINDVINIIRVRTIEKQILFTVNLSSSIPDRLIGDETRIRQILVNLLGNAVKYTHDGFISLTVAGEERDDDTVLLHFGVSDSGMGIKPEDTDKLFGNFVQVDMTSNRGVQGTGLGLAITKSLCLAMNGDITVHSEYGRGSTFVASLPQAFSTREKSAVVIDPSDKRVLLYEPRDICADSIARSFEDLGVHCVLAHNEKELRESMRAFDFQFVFISSLLFDNAKKIIGELSAATTMVLLTEYGEAVSEKNVKYIAMPAHSISIANLLNNVAGGEFCGDWSLSIGFSAPGARVLIVDDIATNLKVAGGLMTPYNMQIDACLSGNAAIKKAMSTRYDLILMDHMMPEMDGIETTRRIRASGVAHCRTVPIIALTANAVSGMREIYLENGFNDYLAKPIEISKLNEILYKWIPKEKQQAKTLAATEKTAEIEISGLNVQKGLFHSGGLKNYMEVLASFSFEGEIRLEEITKLYKAGDIKTLTTYVHALKSASASIGAQELSELAEALELAGLGGDTDYIGKNLTFFTECLSSMLFIINGYLKNSEKTRATSGKAPDYEYLSESLVMIGESFKNVDIETAEAILEDLLTYDWEEKVRSLLTKLKYYVFLYDYDNAEASLAELILFAQNSR